MIIDWSVYTYITGIPVLFILYVFLIKKGIVVHDSENGADLVLIIFIWPIVVFISIVLLLPLFVLGFTADKINKYLTNIKNQ